MKNRSTARYKFLAKRLPVMWVGQLTWTNTIDSAAKPRSPSSAT